MPRCYHAYGAFLTPLPYTALHTGRDVRRSVELAVSGYVARRRAGVKLARTANFIVGIRQHFIPLGNPANGTRQSKDGREQRRRDTNGALNNTGVEVDVGVQLTLDKVRIFQRDALELHSQLEQRVVLKRSEEHT